MNKTLRWAALCLCAALSVPAQSTAAETKPPAPAASPAEPSLAETISWLREQVGRVKYHDALNWDWVFELGESKQPCTLVYRAVRTKPATPKSRRIENVETVDMSGLQSEVPVRPWETRGLKLFSVHLNAKTDAVLAETWLTESREPDSRKNFILVRFMEQELAERVAKAFERAIALCKSGKKPEPF